MQKQKTKQKTKNKIEQYEEQRKEIINALTGTTFEGTNVRRATKMDYYNEYKSSHKAKVLSPFDGLPKDGLFIR